MSGGALAGLGSAPSERWRDWRQPALALGVSAGLALLAIAGGWRGQDLPAQVFRIELFRRHGFVLWDSQWFAGHPTLNYSVISPIVGAFVGPITLCAVSGVVAAVCFDRIVHYQFGARARWASLWFAANTVTNLLIGRVTFAFALAIALIAVLALQRGRTVIAFIAAVACSLTSPLAGAFLAIMLAAWGLSAAHRRVPAVVLLCGALVPIAAISLLFPEHGSFPYERWSFAWDVTAATAVFLLAPRGMRVIRWGAALYAAAAIGAYLVASPLGGNMSRFGQYAVGPILVCELACHDKVAQFFRTRPYVAVVAIPLILWPWYSTFGPTFGVTKDPSADRAYYQPLMSYLDTQPMSVGRLEIPVTYRRFEAAYVAPTIALARGWERQLDVANNPIFYKGPLDAATYRQWLQVNGVEYVALPDARLDSSSVAERTLIRSGLPYLHLEWQSQHWQLWRFTGYRGLSTGAASVIDVNADRFTLRVHRAGDTTVHIRWSRHWTVPDNACTQPTSDGWTMVRNLTPGTVDVTQSLGGSPCADST